MATMPDILTAKRTAQFAGVKQLAMAILALLGFGLCAYISIELTRGSGRIAIIWLPNALAVALLLRFPSRNEPLMLVACFVGNLLANLFVGDALPIAMTLSLANSAEIVVAVYLVRHLCGRTPRMDDIHDLARFFLGAGFVGPMVSGLIASAGFAAFSAFSIEGFGRWVLADGLSMLIIAPSAIVISDALARLRMPSSREMIDWLLVFTFGTCVTLFVFGQTNYPVLFLVPVAVLAHAFYTGALGTALAVIMVAVIASVFTVMGQGPIHLLPVSTDAQILVLEAFLASSVLVGLPVSAVLATRERAMRELALLTESITDAILRYDLSGTCTYASPSVARVLGERPEVFIGLKPDDRGHPESQGDIALIRNRLLSGRSTNERLTYRRLLDNDNGDAVYIEADCAIAHNRATGEPEGIVVSARDVTERVKLERELKRATRHAENAARAKAQFLANMSHEIRTPMNGVLGFADLLSQMDLGKDAAHYAELIVSSGRSMMMLLNDILDISKIESGQLVISLEKIGLAKLVEDCVQLHRAGAIRKGVRLTLATEDDLPATVVTDPLRLRQIVLNLIGNAIKFTEEGSIEVKVEREDDRLAISVEDSGIGIDPARLDAIFDPFTQEEASTTRRFGGTGLGLSISRQLAELLGGNLAVSSVPGVGSRFTLHIPLKEAPEHAPAASVAEQDLPARPLRSGAKILLAEDHDVNRMLVSAMLEQMEQRYETAHDGLDAVSKVLKADTGDAPYDLVLMDIQMPGCDGYSATRMIRQAGVSQTRLPIIALTANAFPEDVAAAREAGMQAHLAKPLVFEELAAALARWLPVQIVDEQRAAPQPLQLGQVSHSQDVLSRWKERRGEALEAVSRALETDVLEGIHVEELARTVHKLAGTAGMFGEEELGDKAAALERALRARVDRDVRKRLAEELVALG